jgi:hypothetical protein
MRVAEGDLGGVASRDSITNELQRRELVRLTKLTLRLEGLTRWLIGWTIALFALTLILVYFTIVLARHESSPNERKSSRGKAGDSASKAWKALKRRGRVALRVRWWRWLDNGVAVLLTATVKGHGQHERRPHRVAAVDRAGRAAHRQ